MRQAPPLGVYTVVAVDINFLMGFDDVKPSRFEAARRAALAYAERVIERGGWVASIAFYRRVIPLHFFTRDRSLVREVLGSLRYGERGVSLGDAVREACYLLLSAPPGYALRAVFFTSGGFRMGPPVEPLSVFAASAGIVIDFLTVSSGGPVAADVEQITRLTSYTGGVWEHARSVEEAVAKARLLASREVGAKPGRVWRPGLGVYPPRQLYTLPWWSSGEQR